jgi:dTDP-4-dehydrorhamnose reductase
MPLNILLLGHTGKLGSALAGAFLAKGHVVTGRNSADFDAQDFSQVRDLVAGINPDLIINTAAFLGIDPCEAQPERALRMNTLFPRLLATLAAERDIPLVHFSTDAVFDDRKGDYLSELDTPSPLNLYGMSKYGGDCFVLAECPKCYLFRVPVLFGPSSKADQFVEKMLARVQSGQRVLKVSDDIVSSPSYSHDVAARAAELVLGGAPYGLYHLANQGKASLYEFMVELCGALQLEATVERASFRDFPFLGRKNTYTPLCSVRTGRLQQWQAAVSDYARSLQGK